jgi:hypothetical protein
MSDKLIIKGDTMGNELSVENREDIPKILEAILDNHSSDIVGDILTVLLSKYNHNILIDSIKKNIPEDNKERQDFFIVGIDVYKYKYDEECNMKKAVSSISNKLGIKESTVRTHLDNFRKKIRKDIAKQGYEWRIKDWEAFIIEFIEYLDRLYLYEGYGDDEIAYHEPQKKKTTYKKNYQEFLETKYKKTPF